FGALVPGMEKKNILGILFPSAIFKDRAPVNGALLSVFMGGMKRPDIYSMSDNEIVSIVLDTLELTMKTEQVPDLLRIFRYEHAIPQYDKSTGSRLEAIGRIEREYPGLILAGNIRDGIGMSDRVKQAARIADQIKIIFS
ncbi:MAG TPA: FAD-dependent oxidoreductase, partial [Bacteroidales bacterium]|nr:FAD-dependent oxidoreductase [Bacteroidales bacterium]